MKCFIPKCPQKVIGYVNPKSGFFVAGDPKKKFPGVKREYHGLCWCKTHEKEIMEAIRANDDGESLDKLYKKYGNVDK